MLLTRQHQAFLKYTGSVLLIGEYVLIPQYKPESSLTHNYEAE